MERRKSIIKLAILSFLITSVINWYLMSESERAIDPEIKLTHEEAIKALGLENVNRTRQYYYAQKQIVVRKKTLIPFFFKNDTVEKQERRYYSKDKF